MISANQIAGFLNFISETLLELPVLYAGTFLLKLQIDDVILGGRGQAGSGMPKRLLKLSGGPCSCDLFFHCNYL